MMGFLRMLAIALGMLMTVGFGLCGALGVVASVGGNFGGRWILLVCGLIGLALSYGIGRDVWRAMRSKADCPDDGPRQ
jgi:hypothetical protein